MDASAARPCKRHATKSVFPGVLDTGLRRFGSAALVALKMDRTSTCFIQGYTSYIIIVSSPCP